MKLPVSLIRSFIDIDLSPAAIAETLTLLGLEVDRIENEHPPFSGVVIGEILSVSPHPNAAKLRIAQVQSGAEVFQVVCGAENCRSGIKAAFAKVGALIPGKNGVQVRIEKATLRGVESFGMLCSEDELGLETLSEGILELPDNLNPKDSLVDILWDPVLDISLTPNLGHCMSALGVARELSAALSLPMRKLKSAEDARDKSPLRYKIEVSAPDFTHCPRYMCRMIEGISIGPSPFWLQRKLASSGMKPISNAVDIANFILLLYGQPLHIFDSDRLEGPALSVGLSDQGQNFLRLDGIERAVPMGTLLISDKAKPVAIAGILGAENNAVRANTKNVLVEAAIFNPATIRHAAKKMGLRTESSQRFEKGVDPCGVEEALDAACTLILDLCGGESVAGMIDWKKSPFSPKKIICRTKRVNQILGTQLSMNEIEAIFKRLGFSNELKDKETGVLEVAVPLRRSDLIEEIDLVEEVARIYGYNHIKKPSPRFLSSTIPHDPAYVFEKLIRERLLQFGLQEFLNSDLISKKLAEQALEWIRKGASLLTATHAKTEEYSVLRPSLLPGLLQSAKRNFNFKTQTFTAFEIGRIHFLQDGKLIEEPMAALILTGKSRPPHWSHKTTGSDFFDLKGHMENLFEAIRVPTPSYKASNHLSFHPGRQADIFIGQLSIGSFGEIHPDLLDAFGIKQRILYAEFNLHTLMQQPKETAQMRPLAQFPTSERDWTITLPSHLPIAAVFQAIHSSSSLLLEKAELVDLYTPENSSEKNATFRFTYRDPLKTISFEEVESGHQKLTDYISKLLAK